MNSGREHRRVSHELDAEQDDLVLTVLESFGSPRPSTNPYLVELVRSLPPDIRVEFFSWGVAFRGHYDLFHVHWPEVLLRGTTWWKSVARWIATLGLLMLLRVRRTPIVRTMHNAESHEPPTVAQRWLLQLMDRWTTWWIVLSPEVAPKDGARTTEIVHGHYRDWFSPLLAQHESDTVPGRLVHVGLLRAYKGTGSLIGAFSEVHDPELSLHVLGRIVDPSTARLLHDPDLDPRICVTEGYVSDEVMCRELTEAELVVMPFARIGNSGSVLLALSLGRPVLMPASTIADRLSREVGPGWVHTYSGPLTGQCLRSAIDSLRSMPPAGIRPDLAGREWDAIGDEHARVFRRVGSSAGG